MNTSKTEEIIREIAEHKLKPKQIIEKYGEETLKQVITHLNSQGLSVGDIAAKLNLKSTSHFKQLLKKLGIELKKTETRYMKEEAKEHVEKLLNEVKQNPKLLGIIEYVKTHEQPPEDYWKLGEHDRAKTLAWLNHMEKWSIRKLAKTFKTSKNTIALLLKRYGIQPRKPKRKPIVDPEDKAYLAGLIAGDLTVRISKGSLIAQIGTTHYTPWHQLFWNFFAKYTSSILEAPRYRPDKKPNYEWTLYATLHPKDKWVLQTPKNKIPQWIMENPKQQLPPYLAGLTDTEGGWHAGSWRYNRPLSKGGKKYYRIIYDVTNTNKTLLEEIRDLLNKYFKIKTYVILVHKEGEKGRYSTKPAYKLRALGNEAVELAKLLLPYLKHPEKIERAKLAIKHGIKTLTQEEIQEWRKLREKEKQQTLKDIEQAKKQYQQKHNP